MPVHRKEPNIEIRAWRFATYSIQFHQHRPRIDGPWQKHFQSVFMVGERFRAITRGKRRETTGSSPGGLTARPILLARQRTSSLVRFARKVMRNWVHLRERGVPDCKDSCERESVPPRPIQ